jgi:hypothetical protein
MLYTAIKPPGYQNTNSAAFTYRPGDEAPGGLVDVVNKYYWTLTLPASRKEIPYIRLKEYEVNETTISNQIEFYTKGIGVAPTGSGPLAAYDGLFPKDNPTGFTYEMPFYTDVNLEVTSPEWTSVDTLEAAKGGIVGFAGALDPALGRLFEGGIDLASNAAGAFLSLNYPKVGIMDRPKLWQSHNFRTYTIKFPLFNTFNPDANYPEWIKNRQLCELLINQNLYNKLSFITGVPPVFYDVLIPGQHYCPASCVTNITINNRGNVRLLQHQSKDYNVPDVYDVSITLTDLVIPSKNLFQSIQTKQNQVNVTQATTP